MGINHIFALNSVQNLIPVGKKYRVRIRLSNNSKLANEIWIFPEAKYSFLLIQQIHFQSKSVNWLNCWIQKCLSPMQTFSQSADKWTVKWESIFNLNLFTLPQLKGRSYHSLKLEKPSKNTIAKVRGNKFWQKEHC